MPGWIALTFRLRSRFDIEDTRAGRISANFDTSEIRGWYLFIHNNSLSHTTYVETNQFSNCLCDDIKNDSVSDDVV